MLNFHVKFVLTDRRTDGQTDGQMDRRTTVKQYARDLSIRGHKKDNDVATFASKTLPKYWTVIRLGKANWYFSQTSPAGFYMSAV